MQPLNLFLIRHAESEGNRAERAFSKYGDASYYTDELLAKPVNDWLLTPEGQTQAVAAGQWLREDLGAEAGRSLLLASITIRAQETAGLLLPGLPWQSSSLAGERAFGAYAHLPPQIRLAHGGSDAGEVDLDRYSDSDMDGVESMASLTRRARELITAISCQDSLRTAIVVTHGYLIHACRFLLEQIGKDEFPEMVTSRWIRYCQLCHYRLKRPTSLNPSRIVPATLVREVDMRTGSLIR